MAEAIEHGRNAYRKGCRCELCRHDFLAYKKWVYHRSAKRSASATTPNYVVPDVGEGWRDRAACKGVDLFYFFDDETAKWRHGKQICASCDVISECRSWALSYPAKDLSGLWAGMTQRDRLRHQNNQKEEAPTCPTPVPLRRIGRVSGYDYGDTTNGSR